MPDQEGQEESERRWERARVIATIADAVARFAELVLRR